MYENPELLLSAELQLILVEILCRKSARSFTAKNFKQIDLIFCTCWLFSISFHHNFSHWNLLTPYKILKATFFYNNMWQRNSFEYVVGNIFFVSAGWLFMKMNNIMAATVFITISLCRWMLNKLSSAGLWKIFQKNLDMVLFPLLEKCISRCIERQHVLHSAVPTLELVLQILTPHNIAETWVSVFFPHSVFFLVIQMDCHWMPQPA